MARSSRKLKLDLGAGQNPRKGFKGVDIWEGADIVCDLFAIPWPWDDSSVDELHCSHFVEHTPMYRPDGRDGLILHMDECWRILKAGGPLTIVHPFFKCERAFQDPTHRRFITPTTWHYFDRDWRSGQQLDHYPIEADFEVLEISWSWYDAQMPMRSDEAQQRAVLKDWDTVADLHVTLKARKP